MAKIRMSGCPLSVCYFHWWFFIQMTFSDVAPHPLPGKFLGNIPFIFAVLSSCRVGDFHGVSVSKHWLGSICYAQFWLRYFTQKIWDFEQVPKISFLLILFVKHKNWNQFLNWRMFDMEHSLHDWWSLEMPHISSIIIFMWSWLMILLFLTLIN